MRWLVVLVAAAACGDGKDSPDAGTMIDAPDVPIDANPNNPATLMDTGLCVDAACTQIAAGIRPYVPRFELYSDGASKKRWIYLPPGTQIDTTDMDFWQFPIGTKLWKEFTRDNVRIETRLVMRIGAGDTMQDWFYVAYAWNSSQDATTAEPFGVNNANGTTHDIPSRSACRECHENTAPSRVLGFSAIELDHDAPDDNLDLGALVAGNLLTAPPTSACLNGCYFPLPGDATYVQPALGYMHANCGHCHNPKSKVFFDKPLQLRLTVGTLGNLTSTPTYQTAVNVNATSQLGGLTKIVDPRQPDNSILIYRFQSTDPTNKMPALGVEVTDETATALLRAWIANM